MQKAKHIKKEFDKSFFFLNEELISYLNKNDPTGKINNVTNRLDKECFALQLYEEDSSVIIEIFYINNRDNFELKGNLIRIDLNNPNYSSLLFYFCRVLALNFPETNEITTFNTYQKQLRTVLEKEGYFTLTNFDCENLKEGTFITTHYKGIKKITFIPIVDFYREFFDNNYEITSDNKNEYVYLMIDIDSSLIKIGFSKNPIYREKTLHSQKPKIHLIACWEANRSIETKLHRKYKQKRVRGEYFRLNLNDLNEIKETMLKLNT